MVNYDCTRALERAWTIELLNRHGIAWAHLRRNTTMTRLFAQPDGRISKSMSARRGDAWGYHLNTRRLEERATWRLALAAAVARHDMPRLGPLLATPHMHTLVRGVQHIFLKIPTNAHMHKEKNNQNQPEYTGLSIENRSFLEGRYSFVCHFIHFVPMELILLFRTDHANLSKPIPDI